MNVPLVVNTVAEKDSEKLSIWFDGKNKIIKAPTNPYFYTSKELNIPCIKLSVVEKIRLSDYQPKRFYKYEFNTRKDLVKYRSEFSYEDNIPFLIRCRIDFPNMFTKYGQTKELKFLYFDVEQFCPEGKLFPTFDDRIISIAWCTNDRKIKCAYLKKENETDKKLLERFIEEYVKIDPDVIVGYNHKEYDLPLIFERCKINNIDLKPFSKNNTEPFKGGKNRLSIEGRICYDILDSTRSDQSLTGNVPNKGLKVVSNHFGFKETMKPLEGSEISKYIGTKELIQYNKEDVSRTLLLFDVYWDGITYLAEDLKIPLNDALNLSTTDLSLVTIGDFFREHNIVSNGDNITRYPEIFQRQKKAGEANYQGALVFIKKRGLFTPILKADYGSMYPSIVATFSFSPDTCTILDYEPYKKGGFRIEEDKNTFTYYIPDSALRKTVVVQVVKKKGFLSEAVHKFLTERAKFKKEWKETGSKVARARSDIAKVKANGGIYGATGSGRNPFGFAPIAVATTGIGRECIKLLIDVLEKLYPGSVVEVDTDGVYFTAENWNEERIIHYFNIELEKKFKKKLDLTIDVDAYDCGYFHRAKNYILKKGDNIILHGAAMKASSKDNISKSLIKDLARAKLNGKSTDPTVVRYKQNLTDFPLQDFAMQVQMGMHLHQYKNKNCISVNIAMQAQKHFKLKPRIGNNYHYIKTNGGYTLYQLTKKKDIDFKYYRKKVDKILEMLDSEYELTAPVGTFLDGEGDEWQEDFEEVKKTKKVKNQPMNIDNFL